MKIAFASNDGSTIDEHFGRARRFSIWEVSPSAARLVTRVILRAPGVADADEDEAEPAGETDVRLGFEMPDGDEEDGILARANVLLDCAIVFSTQIGGPAAAKLTARRILPMKTGTAVAIATMVADLQRVLQQRPPPWLRKAMERGNNEPHAGQKSV